MGKWLEGLAASAQLEQEAEFEEAEKWTSSVSIETAELMNRGLAGMLVTDMKQGWLGKIKLALSRKYPTPVPTAFRRGEVLCLKPSCGAAYRHTRFSDLPTVCTAVVLDCDLAANLKLILEVPGFDQLVDYLEAKSTPLINSRWDLVVGASEASHKLRQQLLHHITKGQRESSQTALFDCLLSEEKAWYKPINRELTNPPTHSTPDPPTHSTPDPETNPQPSPQVNTQPDDTLPDDTLPTDTRPNETRPNETRPNDDTAEKDPNHKDASQQADASLQEVGVEEKAEKKWKSLEEKSLNEKSLNEKSLKEKSLKEKSAEERWLNGLNDGQRQAVEACLQQQPFSCIHGPPGTGKTTTVAALIHILHSQNARVLVTGPSNISVDNVLTKCVDLGSACLRMGHPARQLDALHDFTIARVAKSNDFSEVLCEIREELRDAMAIRATGELKTGSNRELAKRLNEALARKEGITENRPASRKQVRFAARKEMELMRRELHTREKKMLNDVLTTRSVCFATCTGSMAHQLRSFVWKQGGLASPRLFDWVIVDEAGKANALETLMPCLLGKRVVLSGDPKQLQTVVKSRRAEALGFGESLMARLMLQYPESVAPLHEQYRMHGTIMDWVSGRFYDSTLTAPDLVLRALLPNCLPPLRWIDTAGVSPTLFQEIDTAAATATNTHTTHTTQATHLNTDTKIAAQQYSAAEALASYVDPSRCNPVEAYVVVKYLLYVLKDLEQTRPPSESSSPAAITVGVLTPYARQMKLIQRLVLAQSIEPTLADVSVCTVDGFQGREADVIIVSLVRSNDEACIGFVDSPSRLNVTISRAKKHCVVVGDSSTVCTSATLQDLYAYCERLDAVSSVLEYVGLDEAQGVVDSGFEFDELEDLANAELKKLAASEKAGPMENASPVPGKTPPPHSQKNIKKKKKSNVAKRQQENLGTNRTRKKPQTSPPLTHPLTHPVASPALTHPVSSPLASPPTLLPGAQPPPLTQKEGSGEKKTGPNPPGDVNTVSTPNKLTTPNTHTQAAEKKFKKDVSARLSRLLNSPAEECVFVDLTSFQRMVVHEIAAAMGLGHASANNENNQRVLRVWNKAGGDGEHKVGRTPAHTAANTQSTTQQTTQQPTQQTTQQTIQQITQQMTQQTAQHGSNGEEGDGAGDGQPLRGDLATGLLDAENPLLLYSRQVDDESSSWTADESAASEDAASGESDASDKACDDDKNVCNVFNVFEEEGEEEGEARRGED